VPTYPTTERVIRSIRGLIEAGERRAWPPPAAIDAERDLTRRIFKKVLSEGRDTLTEIESKDVLRAYGIKTTTERIARTAEEASSLASELGFPVVLKVLSPDITHKTDVGGVVTDVGDSKEASKTFEQIMENVRKKDPRARLDGVLIQNQLSRGIEVLVGSTVDNDFGPVVAFGLGGVFVEAFRDISYGLAPVSIEEALSMISNTKAAKLLEGVRGQRPTDLGRLADMIMRASFLATEQPIVEMDLNPVIASADDCVAADARIRIKS